MDRLRTARARLLSRHPFYGLLAMRLDLGTGPVGTACTDMRRILFDPVFMEKLSDEALTFVFCHEVMHCVLCHCTRGREKDPLLYNIAADIVVNSLILESLGLTSLDVAGASPMHLVPDGREGRLFTTEEVYAMLEGLPRDRLLALAGARQDAGDNHEVWQDAADPAALEDAWKEALKEVRGKLPGQGTPGRLRDVEPEPDRPPLLHWPTLLQRFCRLYVMDRDYSYQPPDPRYEGLSDFFFPSFPEIRDYRVRDLFVAIDTSASIDDETLRFLLEELAGGMRQVPSMNCLVSFFDTEITEPVPLSRPQEIADLAPKGGGGTSFEPIFKTLGDLARNRDVAGTLILTDGYASFPEEAKALGLPVLWIIADSLVEPPWGATVHVRLEDRKK